MLLDHGQHMISLPVSNNMELKEQASTTGRCYLFSFLMCYLVQNIMRR